MLIQHPATPVNDPINKIRSKSPSPIPFILRKYLKILLIMYKKEYPKNAPKIDSVNDNGNNPYALKIQPKGTRNSVVNREISIVSASERIVTMSAEKNMK